MVGDTLNIVCRGCLPSGLIVRRSNSWSYHCAVKVSWYFVVTQTCSTIYDRITTVTWGAATYVHDHRFYKNLKCEGAGKRKYL